MDYNIPKGKGGWKAKNHLKRSPYLRHSYLWFEMEEEIQNANERLKLEPPTNKIFRTSKEELPSDKIEAEIIYRQTKQKQVRKKNYETFFNNKYMLRFTSNV